MHRSRSSGNALMLVLLAAAVPADARTRGATPRSSRPPAAASAPAPSPEPAPAGTTTPAVSEFSQQLNRGLRLYEEEDYSGALSAFESAYEMQQLPRLLYNMGRAHMKLGHAQEALKRYQQFLRLDADAPEDIRKQALEGINRANELLPTEQTRARKESPGPTEDAEQPADALGISAPRTPEPAPLHKRWWLWTAIGGGVALLGGAVAGGVVGYRQTHPALPMDQVPSGVPLFTVGL